MVTRKLRLALATTVGLASIVAPLALLSSPSSSARAAEPHPPGTAAFAAGAQPPLSATVVLNIAQTLAEQAGDPTPTLIQHVEGTRAQLNASDSGGVVSGPEASYLIAERGSFVANGFPRPAGSPVPTGSVITIIIDAVTGQITDEGIENRYPKLSALGPVATDLNTGTAIPALKQTKARRRGESQGRGSRDAERRPLRLNKPGRTKTPEN